MAEYSNLIELLEGNRRSDRGIRFISGAGVEELLSFDDLAMSARMVSSNLQDRHLKPGSEVVLYTRSNIEFLRMFWGAIYAGLVPVPIAVGTTAEHRAKLLNVLSQLKNPTLLADAEVVEPLCTFCTETEGEEAATRLRNASIEIAQVSKDSSSEPNIPVSADALAFVQYSSGSTGDPKGVRITHDNIVVNCRAIVAYMGWTDSDVGLSWMPLTHDMGLIVMHLSLLSAGMSHAIIDTDLFVRRPLLWLEKASELGASVLCSPNFGYKHYLKLFERKGADGVDLSRVRTIFNGAEPISWQQCDEFLNALAPHNLNPNAMLPVYGLAEATVGVSIPPLGSHYERITVDRHHLNTGEFAEQVSDDHVDAVSFVKVGVAINNVDIRIVDERDSELPNGHVGHIQLRGRSVTSGFYDQSEDRRETFTADGWLRTGDCGLIHEGQLVITGRQKDIVIVNGQNYYAHDLEGFVQSIDGLELGKVVVAAGRRPQDGAEKVVVFILHRKREEQFRELAALAEERIAGATGIQCDFVVPVTRIPKTTSGKVQRNVLARNFNNGEYDRILVAAIPESRPADELASVLDFLVTCCNEHSGSVSVGPDDDLFDVGISSLMLTEFVLAVDERFPSLVDIDDLFDYPTLSVLASRIEELQNK